MLSLLDNDTTAAVLANQLELHCLDIRLEQNTSESPRALTGPGVIQQDESGHLQLRLYDTDADQDYSGLMQPYPAGRVLPPSAFYSITATDSHGRCWTGDHIHPFE